MILAAKHLRDDGGPIATIARRVGYGSEFAFAKAFKREFGAPPGRYRKNSPSSDPIAV
jgi:AraC-like DNA-binding protein